MTKGIKKAGENPCFIILSNCVTPIISMTTQTSPTTLIQIIIKVINLTSVTG